jgi:hypothetical protein
MNIYYFVTIKLTTYNILVICTLKIIIIRIFAILYKFWPILTRHGSGKQNYPTHLL